MTLEAGKEMDRRCVLGWLNEVYRHPTVAFNTYSDEQQIEFAHDALVLLKEKEAVEPKFVMNEWRCGACGHVVLTYNFDINEGKMGKVMANYCPSCGRSVKWDV